MTKSLVTDGEGRLQPLGPELIAPPSQDEETIDLFEILRVLLRRWLIILLVVTIVLTIMALRLFSTTPMYRAEAHLYIDQSKLEVVDLNAVVTDVNGSSAAIDGEVMLLRSRAMAERVVRSLDLVNNEVFKLAAARHARQLRRNGEIEAVYQHMLSRSGDGQAQISASPEQVELAVSRLLKMVQINRFGQTSVFGIRAHHHDPQMAKVIANEYANQYIKDKSDARQSAAKAANIWLRNRINELAEQVRLAEAGVESFRAESGLLNLRDGTITQQDVQNTITTLDDLRAQRAEMNANLRQIQRSLSNGRFAVSVGEALDSGAMQDLRRQLRTTEQALAEASSRYLPGHPKMVRLEKERGEILAGMRKEVERHAVQLRSQLETLNRLVQEQETRLDVLQAQLAGDNASNVRLRELEREAETSRFIYEQFLARFKETREQEYLNFSQARVISPAVRPFRPYSPKVGVNIGVGMIAAIFASLIIVVLVEIIDRTFWSGVELERRLRVPFLGILPRMGTKGLRRLTASQDVNAYLQSFRGSAARNVFSEVQLHSGGGGLPYVIAVTATDRAAGHHSVLVNLALVAQQEIGKTIIVDGDASGKGISQRLYGGASAGINEVVEHGAHPSQVVIPLGIPGIDVLALEDGSAIGGVPVQSLGDLFDELRTLYSVIIIDSGVLEKDPVNRVFAKHADGAIIVGRQKGSTQEKYEALMRLLVGVRIQLFGVVMTHQSIVRRKIARYLKQGR